MTDFGPLPQPSVARMRLDNDVAGLSRALREADQDTAECAAASLAEIGTPECAQVLLSSLSVAAPRTRPRRAIIRGLGRMQEIRAVPVLIAILRAPGKSWEGPREDAIWALGRIGDPQAVPAILDATEAPFTREALDALVRIGGPDVAPGLLVRLWGCVSSNNLYEREEESDAMMVVLALRHLRSPLAVPALAYLAGSPDCPLAVRHAAAEGLRDLDLAEAGSWGRLYPLRRALENPDPRLSTTAADAMARVPGGMRELRWRVLDKQQHVRQAVCIALGDHGDASDVAVLSERLARDSDIIVRRAAAAALAKLGGDAAAKALIDALADQRTCEAAASAVAALRTAPSGTLRRIAEHSTGQQRNGAVTALGLMSDRQAAPLLLPMLSSQDLPLRIAAIDALGRLRYQPASSGLAEILDDQEAGGRVRARAAWALGRLGGEGGIGPDGVASLVAGLDDPIEAVRLRAAEALASVPSELHRGPAARALARVAAEDPVTDIRHAAVGTLAAFGPVGRPELRLLAESGDSTVRAAAITTYAQGATSTDLGFLEQIATGEDGDAALAAIRALGSSGDSRAIAVLAACVRKPLHGDGGLEVQFAALDAITAIGGEPAKDAVVRIYHDPRLSIGLVFRAQSVLDAMADASAGLSP